MEPIRRLIVSIVFLLEPVICQEPVCSTDSLFSYVTSPRDPCQVFVCYAGRMLFTPFECRPDFVLDACSRCIFPSTPVVTMTTSPTIKSSFSSVMTLPTGFTASPISFEDSHVIGGHRAARGVGVSEGYCLLLCQLSPVCRAVDYNKIDLSCWLHEADTACSPLVSKPDVVHYKLTACSSTTTVSSNEVTVTPSPANALQFVQTPNPQPTPDPSVPNGFVTSVAGKHVKGGTRTLVSVTEQQCLDFCLMESFCLAVDYNTRDRTCFIHFKDTYCMEQVEEEGTNHYSRLPCVVGVENSAFEVRNKFHVLGGNKRVNGVSLEICLTICYIDPTCAGIDFDSRAQTCYTFIEQNTCDPLIPKDFCIHVTLQQCTFPPKLSVPKTTPAPTTASVSQDVNVTSRFVPPVGDFIAINYPGPLVLPSQWQAYPGMGIENGEPIGGMGMTGDQCLTLCLDDPDCEAVDFNSGDGTCYKHDSSRKCNVLNAANAVYHLKKPGLCRVIAGTSTPYSTPLGIAP